MKKTVTKIFFLILFLTGLNSQAQQKIKDGTGSPATSLPAAGSILELQSTQAGLRMPQIALTTTTTWLPLLGSGGAATSPGMTVYNTNAGITSSNTNYPALGIGEYYWDGTGWVVKNPVAAAAYIEPWFNAATNTGATGNAQNIYQTGSVAIGQNTVNPVARLTVNGIDANQPQVLVTAPGAGISGNFGVTYRAVGIGGAWTGYLGNNANIPLSGAAVIAGAGKNIYFMTGNTNGSATGNSSDPSDPVNIPRMTILDNTGNVGIGTVAPNADLHVNGTVRVMPSGSYTGDLILGTASNDGIQLLSTATSAYLAVQRSSQGANLYLTKDFGTGLVLNYQIFNRSGTTIGSISSPVTGNSIAYNTTSDIRLKENVQNTHYGLTDLMKIRVADYNYKADKTKTAVVGFLAQDLYKIYPDAVTPGGANEKTEPWQVDYSKLTPLLVKAIQDQQVIIENLEARLKKLEDKK
jgi:hypothetical protein